MAVCISFFLPRIGDNYDKFWSQVAALQLTFSLSSLYLRPLNPWLRFVWQIIKEMELVGKNACNYWEYSLLSRGFLSDQLHWKKRTMIIENFPPYQACYIRLNLAPIKRPRTKPATALKLPALLSHFGSQISLCMLCSAQFTSLAHSLPLHLMLKFKFLCFWSIEMHYESILPANSNIFP